MRHMKRGNPESAREEEALADALRLLCRDSDEAGAPPHIKASVMRAWDARAADAGHGPARVVHRRVAFAERWRLAWTAAALAACVLAAAMVWTQRSPDESASGGGGAATLGTIEETPAASDVHLLSFTDGLIDEDPASLQYVRLSVQPSALTAFGYPLADPADSRPVSVEMLVGIDGVPRGIRPLHVAAVQE